MNDNNQGVLADSVLLPVAEKATGLTVKAMRRKIADGVWIYIRISGYISWVRSGRASKSGKPA